MKIINLFRLRKKKIYAAFERKMSILPPRVYLALLPKIFRLFHPKANIDHNVKIRQGDDKLWYVYDAWGELCVPSHRRFSRYFCRGLAMTIETVVGRYIPEYAIHGVFQDATVVDVGANIGEFSIGAIKHGAARCVVIEPDPTAACCLRVNLERYKTKVDVFENLVDESPGERVFYLAAGTADSSFIKPQNSESCIDLKSVTLDILIEDLNINDLRLLKVEAEGAEPEVLVGAKNTLLTQKPIVTVDTSCERFGKSTYDQCKVILVGYGYQVERHRDGMHLYAFKK